MKINKIFSDYCKSLYSEVPQHFFGPQPPNLVVPTAKIFSLISNTAHTNENLIINIHVYLKIVCFCELFLAKILDPAFLHNSCRVARIYRINTHRLICFERLAGHQQIPKSGMGL